LPRNFLLISIFIYAVRNAKRKVCRDKKLHQNNNMFNLKNFVKMKRIEKKKSISLFSAETLDSIAMALIMGGEATNNCNGGYCGNCVAGCGSQYPQCKEGPIYYAICSPVPVNVNGCINFIAGCYPIPQPKIDDTTAIIDLQ